jgi:hypothetical protein
MRHFHLYSFAALIVLLLTQGLSASEVRGVIIKADDKSHEVTLEARGKGMRGAVLKFVTNADTQVRLGNQPASLADLAPGKRVRVVYKEREGRLIAFSIQITSLPLLLPPGGLPFGGPPAPNPPVSNDPNAITGVLRRISVTEGEIIVVASGGGSENEMVVIVADSARILRDGKPIRLEDLKENESVVIHAVKKDNKFVARSIELGATTGLAPPPQAQNQGQNRIQKIRRILQTIDKYLEMMGEQQPPPP